MYQKLSEAELSTHKSELFSTRMWTVHGWLLNQPIRVCKKCFSLVCYIENNTWACVDMEFFFECLTLMFNALNDDYKNNNGRNFQFKKFSSIHFVHTDRRTLSGKRPKSAGGKSSSCRFSFSAERNTDTKAAEYVNFGFSFSILVFLPI